MVNLYDKDSGAPLGAITEEQFALMREHLEEESVDDDDYYLTPATLDLLRRVGADAELLGILDTALAGREECDIRWARA